MTIQSLFGHDVHLRAAQTTVAEQRLRDRLAVTVGEMRGEGVAQVTTGQTDSARASSATGHDQSATTTGLGKPSALSGRVI